MSYDNRDYPDDDRQRNIDLGGLEVPDFRRRISDVSERYAPESHRRASEYDEYGDEDDSGDDPPQEQGGCMDLFTGNRATWLFIGVLIIAALRGGQDTRGCMPSRGCMNVLFTALGGIGLIIGGLYVGAETEAEGVALAMSCAGTLVCGGSLSGIGLLIWGIMRSIDVNPFDDNDAGSGGFLDNILGGLGGGR